MEKRTHNQRDISFTDSYHGDWMKKFSRPKLEAYKALMGPKKHINSRGIRFKRLPPNLHLRKKSWFSNKWLKTISL